MYLGNAVPRLQLRFVSFGVVMCFPPIFYPESHPYAGGHCRSICCGFALQMRIDWQCIDYVAIGRRKCVVSFSGGGATLTDGILCGVSIKFSSVASLGK